MRTETRQIEVRLAEDPERRGPGILEGVLLPYETRASDRPELFEAGSMTWPADGVLLREMHRRESPLARFIPEATETEVRVKIQLPDTTAGRDAATNVRAGVLKGLSVEFHAVRETVRAGVRVIQAAVLTGAGLVDFGGLRGRNGRGSGQRETEAAMAVTISAADLAAAIGKPLPVAERLLPVSSALVERYAPEAPEAIQNEATIRCSGWLANQPASACSRDQVALPGGLSQVFAFRPSLGALRGSGAMGLLSTFKVRRGGLISGSGVQVPQTSSGAAAGF